MRIITVLISTLILLIGTPASGQDIKLKGYTGAMRYVGDLAPYSFLISNSDSHLSLGLSVGLELNDYFSVNLRYFSGTVSGDDFNSNDDTRRKRNLRFNSPINEIGLVGEFDLNNLFLGGFEKYRIHFIAGTWINYFSFNPRTDFRGDLVFLQPLGTEGQELPGSESFKNYELREVSIPFNFGIEFRLTDRMNMGIEVSSRWTMTDYLDDVSNIYPDLDLLRMERGDLAAELSDRGPEIGLEASDQGSLRGNADSNDKYIFTGIYLAYYFGDNPIRIEKTEPILEEPGLVPTIK